MVLRNENMAKLKSGYLFPEIARKRRALLERVPDAHIISLGIGDTTEPLPPHVTQALSRAAAGLGTPEGYSGYGDDSRGWESLRAAIVERFYKGRVEPDEVFVSDGAKCDVGRLQTLFGPSIRVAVQDPAYPVYVDGSVIHGQTGVYNDSLGAFEGIVYMPCTPENDFFPDPAGLEQADIIYICSPNNPTGAVATREQLKSVVEVAGKNGSIVLFDSAYSAFIRDPDLPRSIFEIEGSREVAIETGSFSKFAGFTGVRLGWTVVPKELCFQDGTPVIQDWTRLVNTLFNGASNIVQAGGLAALDETGFVEVSRIVDYYMENAGIIRSALEAMSYEVYGGTNSPYIWARIPGKGSWEAFEEILEKCHVVCTPGVGFGKAGEGFVRFSSFGHREEIEQAVQRLTENL